MHLGGISELLFKNGTENENKTPAPQKNFPHDIFFQKPCGVVGLVAN
jgi:hypothetical protein